MALSNEQEATLAAFKEEYGYVGQYPPRSGEDGHGTWNAYLAATERTQDKIAKLEAVIELATSIIKISEDDGIVYGEMVDSFYKAKQEVGLPC